MNDPSSRPEISVMVEDIAQYDTVLIGFPIWQYTAPTIIKTFLESYDFLGKRISLFATSGGSKFGNAVNYLKPCVDNSTQFVSEKIMNGVSDTEISDWIKTIIQ